ncbi:MAG: phage holin family protein [Planctomyces sp.]|nr:phage holin family protein [Planctomyces sp.]
MSPSSFPDSLARFIRDLLRMGDLQLQLLTVDLRDFGGGVKRSAFLILVALCLLLGALPVLMLGLAGVLHRISGLAIEYSWLLVGVFVSVTGLGMLWHAVRQLITASASLRRSQMELTKNLEWVRGVLHRD